MPLRMISGPQTEPASVDEVKTCAHISHDVEDLLIKTWISSARREVENYLRKSLIDQTHELAFDTFPEMPLYLPMSPVQSVTSITYIDYLNVSRTMLLTDFIIDTDSVPARIAFAYGKIWPAITLRDISSVLIRYTAGYGTQEDVPENIKDAILLYCSWRNENRAAETGFPDAFYNLIKSDRLYQ